MLESINNMLTSDKSYNESLKNYNKIDGIIAITYYIFLIFVYYLTGKIGFEKKLYLGVPCNIALAIICILIVKLRRQKLNSIGITLNNIKKSVILGMCTGMAVITCMNIIPGIIAGQSFNTIRNICVSAVTYFTAIAFIEELIFRGFLQTRIYGIVKSDYLAIFITAIMFSSMHIPFQMASINMNLKTFLATRGVWLVGLVFIHVIMNFLYRKYNNIFCSTIFHGFLDLGGSLFR